MTKSHPPPDIKPRVERFFRLVNAALADKNKVAAKTHPLANWTSWESTPHVESTDPYECFAREVWESVLWSAPDFEPWDGPAPRPHRHRRRQRKPSVAAMIQQVEKSGKAVSISVTLPDGTKLTFGEAEPTEAGNALDEWIAKHAH